MTGSAETDSSAGSRKGGGPPETARWTEWLGLLRSLLVYWRPGRRAGLRRLYGPFVDGGDLVFDIGAHLGDRTAAFASLGARVVALEPQPHVNRWLRRLAGRRPGVTVLSQAVGREPGTAALAVSRRNPTVSSLSASWRERVRSRNPTFRDVRWDDEIPVTVTTLDELVERHGAPRFCKIDVEGHEAAVLEGLSRPVPALSVEFVTGWLDGAVACVRRLRALGAYEFNAVAGEGRRFLFERWMPPGDAAAWLEAGAGGVSSGDLFARLRAESDGEDGDARGSGTDRGGPSGSPGREPEGSHG